MRIAGAVVAATCALAVTGLGAGASAHAASGTLNPFGVNGGFSVLANGDLSVNNSEVEGSIAAFGSVATGNPNGYPVIHKAAGEPDYTVPLIDGVPVRILAQSYVGTGALDVSNRDDSSSLVPGAPEATAVVKLADVTGLTGSARGGGVGPAAGGDFLRVTNATGGIIDLKAVPYAGSTISALQTEKSSVAEYFGDIDAHVAAVESCLVSLYDVTTDLARVVAVDDQGGMVFPSGFASDRPNVLRYADVAGKIVKMDRAGGYRPTAVAPLIIALEPGTSTLGTVRIEGWSAVAGADQSLARHIMVDASDAAAELSVDGFEMGAIWAPGVDLRFASSVTTNGQWFADDVTTAGGGEIHHHLFQGVLPCTADESGLTPEDGDAGSTPGDGEPGSTPGDGEPGSTPGDGDSGSTPEDGDSGSTPEGGDAGSTPEDGDAGSTGEDGDTGSTPGEDAEESDDDAPAAVAGTQNEAGGSLAGTGSTVNILLPVLAALLVVAGVLMKLIRPRRA